MSERSGTLAIDTASPAGAVAVARGDRVFEEILPHERRASEELLNAVARMPRARRSVPRRRGARRRLRRSRLLHGNPRRPRRGVGSLARVRHAGRNGLDAGGYGRGGARSRRGPGLDRARRGARRDRLSGVRSRRPAGAGARRVRPDPPRSPRGDGGRRSGRWRFRASSAGRRLRFFPGRRRMPWRSPPRTPRGRRRPCSRRSTRGRAPRRNCVALRNPESFDYRLLPAEPRHLDEIARIERESFPVPWKREFFETRARRVVSLRPRARPRGGTAAARGRISLRDLALRRIPHQQDRDGRPPAAAGLREDSSRGRPRARACASGLRP